MLFVIVILFYLMTFLLIDARVSPHTLSDGKWNIGIYNIILNLRLTLRSTQTAN